MSTRPACESLEQMADATAAGLAQAAAGAAFQLFREKQLTRARVVLKRMLRRFGRKNRQPQ